MNDVRLTDVTAHEVLDSRGKPTLSVTLTDDGGCAGTAQVPAGASTGRREPRELRDGDARRFGGAGVLAAVGAVNGEIRELLCEASWTGQEQLDAALTRADGSDDLHRLGSNSIIGVSLAFARLTARRVGLPLWQTLRYGEAPARLPVPHFNVLNGGAHTRTRLDFQEFMIAPVGAPNLSRALRAGAEIYAALRGLLFEAGHATGLGDEGGFAPEIAAPEDAIRLLRQAIEQAGYVAGTDGVAIALDPAANGFQRDDGDYEIAGTRHSAAELVERYAEIVDEHSVWSIEDPLGEDDRAGWRLLAERLAERVQIVGDDLLVSHAETIEATAQDDLVTAALIKPNQAGTVSATRRAIEAANRRGLAQMISHRSGETPDDFIADLAVGCSCGELKSGAPARGERVAKYNRLLVVEAANPGMPFGLAGP